MKTFRVLGKLTIFCLVLFLFFQTTAGVSAQVSQPELKIDQLDDSNFPNLTVYAAMLDSQGFPILGLDPSSFNISEDNTPIKNVSIEPIENTDQPLAVVIAIDVSGSMSGQPLTDAEEAARDFISKLQDKDLVGLVTYSDTVQVVSDLTTDHDAVYRKLDKLYASGETAMRDAVVAATDLLKDRSERTAIIVLTDGKDNKSIHTLDETINAAVRWMTPVYPIGFGSEINNETIEKLAQGTGGTSQALPDSSSLQSSFKAILSVLRNQYKITYLSNLPADGTKHQLTISTEYKGGVYTAEQDFTARPGKVSIAFNDLQNEDVIRGEVKFAPVITTPGEITKFEVLMDGNLVKDVLKAPFELAWDTTQSEPGEHEFTFVAEDNAGNKGETTLSLVIKEPIIITITNPIKDEKLTGKQTIDFSVDHKYDLSSLEVKVNDISLGEFDPSTTSVDWDTKKFQSGTYTISILAKDVNGFSGTATQDVVVEIQRFSAIFWVILFVCLAAVAVAIPFIARGHKQNPAVISLAPVAPAVVSQGSPVLVELAGLSPETVWPLNRDEVRLGRKHDENDIPLSGTNASRRHAIIRNVSGVCTIFSLNPENLVYVNGAGEMQKILEPGDILDLGNTQLRFERRG